MRTIIGLTILAALSVLAYKLFEPIFVYRLGWADMPAKFPAAQAQVADDWREAAQDLDKMLAGARAKLNAPSLSAAISVNGQIVWAKAVGFENIESKIPASTATAYRLGSTAKAVTSVMAGVLIEKGAIDLEAQLSKYMPDWAAPMAGLTVRQVMSHNGGVRNYQLCFCFPAWENLSTTHFDGPQRDTLRAQATITAGLWDAQKPCRRPQFKREWPARKSPGSGSFPSKFTQELTNSFLRRFYATEYGSRSKRRYSADSAAPEI